MEDYSCQPSHHEYILEPSQAFFGWSPIGPLVSGMGSSLAFTIPTGLAEQQANGLPLPAFRTCYGPHRLSAESKSRDLQHLSPVLAHYGNTVLRDMAHVVIRPIDASKPHEQHPPCSKRSVPGPACPFDSGVRGAILSSSLSQEPQKAKRDLPEAVEPCGAGSLSPSVFNRSQGEWSPCDGPSVERACIEFTVKGANTRGGERRRQRSGDIHRHSVWSRRLS